MNIILLRHGQVAGPPALYGATDIELHESGMAAMHNACAELNNPPQLIVSSPLKRCCVFAQQKARQLGCNFNVQPAFSEMNFGEFDGIPFDQHSKHWPTLELFWQNPHQHGLPGAESLQQMHDRVVDGFRALLNKSHETLWLFTHGGVIRLLLAEVLGLDWRNPALYSSLHIAYASRTELQVSVYNGDVSVRVMAVSVSPGQSVP